MDVLEGLGYRVTDGGSEVHGTKRTPGRRLHVIIEGTGDIYPANMIGAHFDIKEGSASRGALHPVVGRDPELDREVQRIVSGLSKAMRELRLERRRSNEAGVPSHQTNEGGHDPKG